MNIGLGRLMSFYLLPTQIMSLTFDNFNTPILSMFTLMGALLKVMLVFYFSY